MLHTAQGLDDQQIGALWSMAESLQSMRDTSAMPGLLKGANIALVCQEQDAASEDARVFERAATQLGARVARIRSADVGQAGPADLGAMARLFGRLYDAVECQGVDEHVIQQLEAQAGIVVYHGIGLASHPVFRGLQPMMRGGLPEDDQACREAVIQSILLSTLR
ncbi:hypothetical protein [Aquabacterium sp.]|uniref:hypothetical protein n=1 Tax=Aquabacterium sp. TaxID=1872578 RepID=UPI003D6D2AFD